MNKKEIIEGLMEIGAIDISPNEMFTWTSGIQSPIYTDNRLTIGDVKLRKLIAKSLSELVAKEFTDAELVGACATAGIPHGTSVADNLDLPMVYFRSQSKGHGTKSLIEGKYTKGQKVVIVEDLISTGKSIGQAIEEAKKEGLEVIGGVAIFSYNLNKSNDLFTSLETPVKSLITIDDILATIAGEFSEDEIKIVKDFIEKLNS